MKSVLSLVLNNRPRSDFVPANGLLLHYLRDVFGLTGTKQGCDGGECGARTVLVDSEPRLACSTLAHRVAGRRVETIEALLINGRRAPEEFMATISIPPSTGWIADYVKIRVRAAVDFPLAGVAAALKREADRIIDLRVAISGTNSAPLLIPTEGMAGKVWDEAVAKRLLAVVGRKLNVLRTTVIGAGYRRRVLLATTRRLVDELWRKPLADAPK